MVAIVPLKLKDSADFQSFSSTDENHLAYKVGIQLADYNSSDVGALTLTSGGDIIGTLSDTYYDQAVGAGGNGTVLTSSTTTTTVYQNTGSVSITDSDYRNMIYQDSDGNGHRVIREMDNTARTALIDRINSRIFTSDYPGVYKLAASAPTGDYAIAVSNVMTDTRTDGNSVQYNLYQRKTMSAPTQVLPFALKRSGGNTGTYQGFQLMTNRQIEQSLTPLLRNRIASSSTAVGSYRIYPSTQTPTGDGLPGTWIAKGTATNTKNTTGSQDYTRTRVSTYARVSTTNFTRDFTRSRISDFARSSAVDYTRDYIVYIIKTRVSTYSTGFVGNFLGNYSRNFEGNYSRNRSSLIDYAGNYTDSFVGNYARALTYLGNYTRSFDARTETSTRVSTTVSNYARTTVADYIGNYSRFQQFSRDYVGVRTSDYTRDSNTISDQDFSRSFEGNYSRDFEGNYSRNFEGNYSRNFEGNYSRNFAGEYARQFARNFEQNYSISYEGNYARNFVVSTEKGFSRNFAGNFIGNYSRNFTGNFIGNFAGNFTGDFTGNYVAQFVSGIIGDSTDGIPGWNVGKTLDSARDDTGTITINYDTNPNDPAFIKRENSYWTVTISGTSSTTSWTSPSTGYTYYRWSLLSSRSGADTYSFYRQRTSGVEYFTRAFSRIAGFDPYTVQEDYAVGYIAYTTPTTYTRTSTRTSTRLSTRDTTTDFSRDYLRTSTRTRSSSYVGTYTVTRNSSFIGNYSRDFLGNYARNYAVSFEGNYSRNYAGLYARAYSANYSRNYAGLYSRNYQVVRNSSYAGQTAPSTRNFLGNYTGNYVGVASSQYFTGNYSGVTYTGNYTGEFLNDYIGNYSRDFTGNYTGTVITSSFETIETYTLYVRVA